MEMSIGRSLNLAISKRSVSDRAGPAGIASVRSAPSMYSSGVSEGRRGMPPRARTASIRVYARMIARRGSGSRSMSLIESSTTPTTWRRNSGSGSLSSSMDAVLRAAKARAAAAAAAPATNPTITHAEGLR